MMSSLSIEIDILLGYLTWGVPLPCLRFLEELQMALTGHHQLVSAECFESSIKCFLTYALFII